VIVLAAVLLAFLKTYYVRSENRGDLIWNADEAYVFIRLIQRGYRLSYLGFLVEFNKESFPFGASAPNDSHRSVLVLRVTRNAVERYFVDDFYLGSLSVVGQNIYGGNLNGGKDGFLMKWSGTHFEPSSPEEQRSVQSALGSGKAPPGPSYDNIDGWSKRAVAGDVIRESPTVYTEKDAKVSITLDGEPLTFVMNSGFIDHVAYIDLSRPGQPPERIWYLDERSHRVNRAEYDSTFKVR
jgi:hypothetical protein